ncbi:hypothetical protein [Actinomadura sp. GTD37]|uniref:hypothetical protein n=1 Tax=Actinomadura sp. GTD37 TaxID=1778030 RepID=UPI0035BF5427
MMTPIVITDDFRGEPQAAVSTDRFWTYQQVCGPALWSVTHVPTGRRYWVAGLDQARQETGDGTAAARLELDREPRPGKAMVEGERTAIRGELTARDLTRMLDHARSHAAGMVADVLARFGLRPDRLDHRTVAPARAGQILGAVYGTAPNVWLDALRAVRPDLVPPHLDRQPTT